jgi:hypothetical protein
MLRSQPNTGSNHGLPSRKPSDLRHDLPAFRQDCRSASTMNRTIHAASAKQGRVRSVHNRISNFLSEIGGTINLNRLSAIEQKPNCEISHASFQEGHALSVIRFTHRDWGVRGPRSEIRNPLLLVRQRLNPG